MGETKSSRKVIRAELDRKLHLSPPSRDLLEELAIACSSDPTNKDATFQYAFALSRSQQFSELRYAISMLDALVGDGYEHQVDCMVGAATALYLLGEFDEARVSLEKEEGIFSGKCQNMRRVSNLSLFCSDSSCNSLYTVSL